MRPILKKRPREVFWPCSVKLPSNAYILRGGKHKQRRNVGPAGLKTGVHHKPPLNSADTSHSDQVSVLDYHFPAGTHKLADLVIKYVGKQRRPARLGEPQKAEEKRSRVAFNLTAIEFDDEVDEASSQGPVFNPELVTAHCFQQLKRKNFHLPKSRRRIIIVPGTKDEALPHPTPSPQAPSPPVPSFNAMDIEDIQEPPVDRKVWLSKRAMLRMQLESFGDVKTWLENKPSITPAETKVLLKIRYEQKAPKDILTSTRKPKSKPTKPVHLPVPQLRLPKPPTLSDLYAYLRTRKVKILEVFNKSERGDGQQVTREEFITALKSIGVPLKALDLEDIVIYLSSLGKQNAITTESLASTYKQWSLAQQKCTLPTAREYYKMAKNRALQRSTAQKQKAVSASKPPTMNLLTVPEVDTKMERRPMSDEDMEEVGKRFRERRRQNKLRLSSIQYMESCRLIRSGKKQFDNHCLPSTISGEMEELVNLSRRDNFLVYLRCWDVCKSYGLPLTEDILMKALLYPGDKIISLKEEIRPIRQPGGYYIDQRNLHFVPGFWFKFGSKKTDKKTSQKHKNMFFEEFEEFTGKLKAKRLSDPMSTHPNYFWPGHLLDKLRLYLPTTVRDNSLPIFTCVNHDKPPAYPAMYSKEWWPIKDGAYMTHAYYDANKVYSI